MDHITEQGIPDWFNLDWYKATHGYGLKEWVHALGIRHQAMNIQKSGGSLHEAQNYFKDAVIDHCKKNLSELTTWVHAKPEYSYPDAYADLKTTTIESMSPMAVYYLYNLLSESHGDFKKAVATTFENGFNSPLNIDALSTPVDMLWANDDQFPGEDMYHLQVDLHASDEKIMTDIKKWLPAARKHFNVPGKGFRFNTRSFHVWREHQVLPYLDLIIWGSLFNKPITQAALVNTLFPIGMYHTDKIRQTTKKYADLLMRDSTMAAMQAQLASTKI